MVNQIIHEFFCRDVKDFKTQIVVEDVVADGIHQVRFSKTCSAVDVKRIVRFCRVIHNGRGGRMGELVAGPDDEIFESVIGIQVGVEKTSMFRAAFMRRASQEWNSRPFPSRIGSRLGRSAIWNSQS